MNSASRGLSCDYLIQSSQDPFTASVETEGDKMHLVLVKRDAMSMRQSDEWGMKTM